jgi:hypothetical protein
MYNVYICLIPESQLAFQVENPSLLVTQVRGMAGFLWRQHVPPAATSSFKVLLCDAVHIALPAWEGVADEMLHRSPGKLRCLRWCGTSQVLQDEIRLRFKEIIEIMG